MALTPEQRQRIAERINEKTGVPLGRGLGPCTACGSRAWSLGDSAVLMVAQDNLSSVALGGRTYPVMPVLCGVCGNTLLFNLITLGLWDELREMPDEVQPQDAEQSNG